MKGQTFILTIVFLVGLVFVVQQLLLQYSSIDLPASFRESDYYFMKNVKNMIQQSVSSASSCGEAEENIEETLVFLNRHVAGGYSISIEFLDNSMVNCTNWNNGPPDPAPVNARIRLVAEGMDIVEDASVYNL